MSGSTFGTHFKITTWGESHGPALGVVIDGCPAGLPLCESDIQDYLNLRRPGQSLFTTQRNETDLVQILSGDFEGLTTGCPISLMVSNQDFRSKDYDALSQVYRPGHADFGFDAKFSHRDYRGGGRSSGRETLGRVAAGAVAVKLLEHLGITFLTYSRSIGPVTLPYTCQEILEKHPDSEHLRSFKNAIHTDSLRMPDEISSARAQEYLTLCQKEGDSVGGVIEGIILGVPAGIGDPVFDKLDANLAKAIFSIGAVKGFEIGDGFAAAQSKGSSHNDAFLPNASALIQTDTDKETAKPRQPLLKTNHAGGILGGISNGAPIVYRAAIKPTPSISLAQETVTRDGQATTLSIQGRHDPIIVPRAVVVVESMAALVLVDLLLSQMGAQLEKIQEFFQ